MKGPHLLIDGRNSAYRAVYANKDSKKHSLVVMLRFMCTWLKKHAPSTVSVFWDAPRATLWRRDILPSYKDREPSRPLSEKEDGEARDVRSELQALQEAATTVFASLNVRQFYKARQEADDLIYAACRCLYPHPTVIVSSDGDFAQIPYQMANVRIWEPRTNKTLDVSRVNPAIKKALEGDVSDCIDGFAGIGDVKSTTIAESHDRLNKFLVTADRKTFLLNMLLVDLSLCPHLLANQMYVTRQMSTPVLFDKRALVAAIGQHKIEGLLAEFDKLIPPFKALGEGAGGDDVLL